MRPVRPLLLITVLLLAAACGEEIGDECSLSADCSPQGDRFCDISSPGGYCTIIGCDYNSCPDEAVCVRFFSVSDSDRTCDPYSEDQSGGDDACSADEQCILSGTCVPRNAESRYCMKKCDSNDDCRENYECRTQEQMIAHGGEPVPPPGEALETDLQPFCAVAPF